MVSTASIKLCLGTLGIRKGDCVLVLLSDRAGRPEKGDGPLLVALQLAIGPQGTVIIPAFDYTRFKPVTDQNLKQATDDELNRNIGMNGGLSRGISKLRNDRFARRDLASALLQSTEVCISDHPVFAFAASGRNSSYLTDHAPFHFPFGANSPLARLHQLNGGILLAGAKQRANCAINLAENWSDMPYARRKGIVRMDTGNWAEMDGAPGCCEGFGKIEPLLRHARLLKRATLETEELTFARIQAVVSMAVALLQGNNEFLLCDDPGCRSCGHARRLAEEQSDFPRQR